LRALHETYRDRGLEVLAFPCNQFGAQEPGTNEEIVAFATGEYGVTFPIFAKLEVNGPGAAPLYAWLRSQKARPDGQDEIAWNFTKFLVDGDGVVIERFEPMVTPEQIGEVLAERMP
jgi:glutathione peroxidase